MESSCTRQTVRPTTCRLSTSQPTRSSKRSRLGRPPGESWLFNPEFILNGGITQMKRGLPRAICCLLLALAAAVPLSAQLATPNAAGVSLGAVYYTVPDVAAHRKIWVDIFGAKPTMVGKTEMLKLPGVFIVLTQGTPQAGTAMVQHLGIWGKDLNSIRAKLTGAGIQTAPNAQFVDLPNSLRLEFIDDPAGPEGPAAHHIHYFVPNNVDGRAWYMKFFGASENG